MSLRPELVQILANGVNCDSFFDAHQTPLFTTTAPASANWPAANRAIAIPFRKASTWVLRQFYWRNGTIVGTVHLDCGLYVAGDDGSITLLTSTGSTTQSGDSVLQVVNVTDTAYPAGLYYMALAMDANSSGVFRSSAGVQLQRALGHVQMASAFTLPATFTPAAIASAYIPVFGVSSKSAGL